MIIPSVVFCASGVVRVTGNGTDLRLYGDNGNYVEIDPGSPASSYKVIMPSSLGTDGQWYKLGSGGQLSFATITTNDVEGLGTAATLDVGIGSNNIVQLNNEAKLPAVDGSLLTGITAEAEPHTHVLADITDAGSAAAASTSDFATFDHTHSYSYTDISGLGDIVTHDSSEYAPTSHTHTLSDITDVGTSAQYDVGTSAGNIVQLNGSGQLPAIDGSLLTGISAGSVALDEVTSPTNNAAFTIPDSTAVTFINSDTDVIFKIGTVGSTPYLHFGETAIGYKLPLIQSASSGWTLISNGSDSVVWGIPVITLGQLDDTTIDLVPSSNDILYFSSGVWQNGSLATVGIAAASHTHTLSDITDVGTVAEYDVGTSANNIVQLNGSSQLPAVDGSLLTNLPSQYPTRCLSFAIFDSSTNTATGDGTVGAVIAASLNGYNLTDVTASVFTAGTTNTTDVQVRRRRSGSNADMLSTPVTVNSGAYTASDGVINTSNDDVQTGDMIYIDVDAISTTPAVGLSVVLTFTKP